MTTEKSDKSYATAVILSAVFGVIGVHHFYYGRHGMGLFDLSLFVLTIYFFIIGSHLIAYIILLIDVVHTIIVTYQLLVGQYKDGDGKLICFPNQKI